MKIHGILLFVSLIIASLILIACEADTYGPDVTVEDCDGYESTIDVGKIPECIEEGRFNEDPFRRVKVRGANPEYVVLNSFIIQGADSQGRWSNAWITVDHDDTYQTLLRLGQGDWINLSCNYNSFEYAENYAGSASGPYAIISLNDCIDLK